MKLKTSTVSDPMLCALWAQGVVAAFLITAIATSVFCPVLYADSAPVDSGETAPGALAKKLPGGVIVHVGCGEGKKTLGLHATDAHLVQGLDTDLNMIVRAREHVKSCGFDGKVSFRHFDGSSLPFTDNLVNLLLVDHPCNLDMEEILRVLAPGGTAYVTGKKIVKPWPKELDEWTHYLYNATGNAVSRDARVGPPRRLQWTAGPSWARSHEHTASVTAMVSGDGKLFYLEDKGIPGVFVKNLPERWSLCARDAFNGVLLWEKDFSQFGARAWGGNWHCREPMQIPRRLVFGGGRLYATLGFRNTAVSAMDPATGELLASYEEGRNNNELIWHDGVLLVRQSKTIADYPQNVGSSAAIVAKADKKNKPQIPPADMGDESIVALDTITGKVLWRHTASRVVSLTLAAMDDKVCYHNLEDIVCLQLRRGEVLWRTDCPTWPDITGTGGTLVMYGDKVVHAGDRGIQVFSLQTGERIWQGPSLYRMSVRHPPDVFVIDDIIWGAPTPEIAGCTGYTRHHKTPLSVPYVQGKKAKGFDLHSGAIARELDLGKLVTPSHHTRCYRSKATTQYLIWPKRGMEFVDIVHDKAHERVDWARGECGYGVMPSAGLLYQPPHPCLCYVGVALDGFNALGPASHAGTKQGAHRDDPLHKGPAYNKDFEPETLSSGEDWPMYRHDPARSGTAGCSVPAALKETWRAAIKGKLTQPIVAGDKVYVVSVDTHTLHALQRKDGTAAWQFVAGGRIDSSPTVHKGLLFFGCSDGMVYCLRASDGALVWRFQAALGQEQCVVKSQLESKWPVHGSVVIQNDTLYFCAGRSSFLDGGLHLYGLQPQTGKVLYTNVCNGPFQDSRTEESLPYHMEGAKTDLFCGDGNHLFIGFNEFDEELKLLPAKSEGDIIGARSVSLHLMSTTGFLDDSWWDRGSWTYDTHWPGRSFDHDRPFSGQIISFDRNNAYVLKGFPSKGRLSPKFEPGKKGYLLASYNIPKEASAKKGDPLSWKRYLPCRARAMVLCNGTLFLAGEPDLLPPDDPYAALEGRRGAALYAVNCANGETLSKLPLDHPPVFDGMSAAVGRIYMSSINGSLYCLGAE